MRIRLSEGETFDLSEDEAQDLYDALWQRTREHGAISAAAKLRNALTWPGGTATTVALDSFETVAVTAARENESAV
ncbi:MAG: hypothetical protein WAL31_06060 [Gaiellaceae bacterium]